MATKTASQSPTLLNVLRSARADFQAQLRGIVDRGINLAEKRTKSVFRFARGVTKRLGGVAKRK